MLHLVTKEQSLMKDEDVLCACRRAMVHRSSRADGNLGTGLTAGVKAKDIDQSRFTIVNTDKVRASTTGIGMGVQFTKGSGLIVVGRKSGDKTTRSNIDRAVPSFL